MKRLFLLISFFVVVFVFAAAAQGEFEKDIIKTNSGNLEITFVGHGTLMFAFGGRVIPVVV